MLVYFLITHSDTIMKSINIRLYLLVLFLSSTIGFSLVGQNINRPNIQGPANMEINSFTGNFFHQRTDLSIPARGLPISMTFSYNAYRDTLDMGYGNGWTHPYNLCYQFDSTGQNMVVDRQDGRRDLFLRNGAGFEPQNGYFDTWTEYQVGKYQLRTKEGMVYFFDDATHKKLTALEDPNGNRIDIAYMGNVPTRISNVAGRSVDLIWRSGVLTEIQDNMSTMPRIYQYSYDRDGNLEKVIDPAGSEIEYAYSTQNGMIQMADENGNLFLIEYDDGGRARRLSSCISELRVSYSGEGETFVVEKGQNGTQLTSYTFDADGKVIEKKGNCCGFEVGYQYDAGNNVDQRTDANQNTATYTYDNRGNRTSETDALGNTSTFTYDPVYNRLTSATDKNGNFSQYTYDSRGNLTRIDRTGGIVENYSYDGVGNLTSVQDGLGNTVAMQYTADGDIRQIDYPIGSESFVYDPIGNLTQSTDANGNTVRYFYDQLNRVTDVLDALNNRLRYQYDPKGNLIARVDEEGRRHDYTYDALDRLIAVRTAAGNTLYGYDQQGNMVSMTDANGHVTRYAYTAENLLAEETDAAGNSITYTYDPKGNLIQKQNPNNTTVNYQYDALDRLVHRGYNGNADNYQYDANGNLTRASNNNLTMTFSYDGNNRMTGKTAVDWGKTILYGYDDADNRSSMTDPDGGQTSYRYDANNRLTRITNPFGETSSLSYDDAGRLTRMDHANATYTAYYYDDADRLDSLVTRDGSGGLIDLFSYTYDSAGNRLSMTDLSGTHHYRYDGVSRLDSVVYSDGTAEIFRYDGSGNRLLRIYAGDSTVYSYDRADRLVSAGGITYTFDGNGNMATKSDTSGTTTYTWDGLDRLIQVDLPNGDAHGYQYDALGNRVAHIAPDGTETRFFWDEDNVLMELNSSNQTQTRYTSAMAMDSWISMRRGSNSYFYHKDGLGSITSLSNASGNIENQYSYEAFGTYRSRSENIVNNYTYTGRRWEEGIDLFYYRARYYDAAVGRFGSKDKVRGDLNFPELSNQFQYAFNSPMIVTDPNGRFGSFFDLGFGGIYKSAIVFVRFLKNVSEAYEIFYEAIGGGKGNNLIPGTNYCGPGGEGEVLGITDFACSVHDRDYDRAGVTNGLTAAFLNLCPSVIKADIKLRNAAQIAKYYDANKLAAFSVHKFFDFVSDYKQSIAKYLPGLADVSCNILRGNQQSFTDYLNAFKDWTINIVRAFDPNDIAGPAGYGPERWVSVKDELPYKIRFENDPDFATAPAQEVVIELPLDDNMDPRSLKLGAFGFANFTFPAPNTPFTTQRLDLVDSLGIFVDVQAGYDVSRQRLFWRFRSIDPATGIAPADPLTGFLAINDSTIGNGEGFVDFSIGLDTLRSQTGDTVSAQANIVFDINPPIFTNTEINLIDALPPILQYRNVPGIIDSLVLLDIIARDDTGGSGLDSYDVFVSENGAPMRQIATSITGDTLLAFVGDQQSQYCVYSLARDNVNNLADYTRTPAYCFLVRDTVFVDFIDPQAGQVICASDTINLSWQARNTRDLDLYFSADSGQSYQPLALGLSPTDSSFQWLLPDSLSGGQYRFRITTSWPDSTFEGLSDSILTIIKLAKPSIIPSGPLTFCDGDSVQLQAPSGFAQYLWSNGDSGSSLTIRNNDTVSLRVVDQNGCISPESDTILIQRNDLPSTPVISASGNTTFCLGDSVALSGPSGFSTYNWSSGDQSSDITVRQSNTFTLSVTDANNCTSLISAPVSVVVNNLPATPQIQVTGVVRFCANDSVVLNGPANFARYRWSNGDSTAGIVVQTAGSYTLTIGDRNGCQSLASPPVTIAVDTLPAKPFITGASSFCEGTRLSVSGPGGFASYQWSTGDQTPSILLDSTATLTLSVTDSNNCTSPLSDSVRIVQNPLPPQPTITAQSAVQFCDGDSVLITSNIPGFTYQWLGSSNTNSSILVKRPGSYSLRLVDSTGCQSPRSNSIRVNVNFPPFARITGSTLFCQGDSTQLSGPVGSFNYRWNTGDTTAQIFVSQAQTVSLIVIDSLGCESDSFSIPISPISQPLKPIITGNDRFCDGDTVTLQIRTAGPITGYRWISGDTTASIAVSQGGNYQVTTLGFRGCPSEPSDTFMVTSLPLPSKPQITAQGQTDFCDGDSVLLSSPLGFSAYSWNRGDTTMDIWVRQTGVYALSVTDSNTCRSPLSDSIAVTVFSLPPTPSIIGDTSFCQGDTAIVNGPAGLARYQWSTGDTTQSLTIAQAATLNLIVTDNNGCISDTSNSLNISALALPPKPLITGDSAFCDGDSIVLTTVAGANTYRWSNGDTSSSITVKVAGPYSVSITNQDQCESPESDTVNISVLPVPAKPIIQRLGTDSLICTQAGLQYQWYLDGMPLLDDTTQQIKVNQSGVYQVQVFDGPCGSELSDSLDFSTSLEPLNLITGLRIYPNPSKGVFFVEVLLKRQSLVELILYDVQGRKLLRQYQNARNGTLKSRIDATGFAKGVYMIKVRVNEEVIYKKIEIL